MYKATLQNCTGNKVKSSSGTIVYTKKTRKMVNRAISRSTFAIVIYSGTKNNILIYEEYSFYALSMDVLCIGYGSTDKCVWYIPAHDCNLNNYNGTDYYVDLVVATAGNSIAQCVYMLDGRLDAKVKMAVLSAFREKVFTPIRRCLEETKPFYWFTVTNNWNSVCLAGVTGAKFVRVAQYGKKIQIINGASPAYSDSRIDMTPDRFLLDYCDNALGVKPYCEEITFPAMGNLSLYLLEFFPKQAWKIELTDEIKNALSEESDELHSYYEKAEILVVRPVSGARSRLAFSAKGSTNNESHNHNDIASYAVVWGKETLAGDQGGPFSYPGDYYNVGAEEKYKCKGSFGHPVPVIDGKMQRTGAKTKGVALSKELTEKKDTYILDCTSAYPVGGLKQYIRSFEYDRTREGNLMIEDKFASQTPVTFETALTTRADWKVLDHNVIELRSGNERVQVIITASDKIAFTSETIEINAPAYTRIGIRLNGKVDNGYIRLYFVSYN